jgi:hypothetical protein
LLKEGLKLIEIDGASLASLNLSCRMVYRFGRKKGAKQPDNQCKIWAENKFLVNVGNRTNDYG